MNTHTTRQKHKKESVFYLDKLYQEVGHIVQDIVSIQVDLPNLATTAGCPKNLVSFDDDQSFLGAFLTLFCTKLNTVKGYEPKKCTQFTHNYAPYFKILPALIGIFLTDNNVR